MQSPYNIYSHFEHHQLNHQFINVKCPYYCFYSIDGYLLINYYFLYQVIISIFISGRDLIVFRFRIHRLLLGGRLRLGRGAIVRCCLGGSGDRYCYDSSPL